jgi:hypothetical protein
MRVYYTSSTAAFNLTGSRLTSGAEGRGNNRSFHIIYVTITSMIAGLPLRFASRPRFSASWSFSGSVTVSP